MYSHDTYGLGHIRRTMAIASHLRAVDINILILTGSTLAGRFPMPDQIDFVRIPGMIKKTNEEYLPLSIKINPEHALDIRKNIIKATAKTFQPDLFIVDKENHAIRKVESLRATDREIWSLAWPVILSQVLVSFASLLDIAMVGRLSRDAVAAVGYATQYQWLTQSVIFAMGIACVALMSRAIGAGAVARARQAHAASVIVASAIALARISVGPVSIQIDGALVTYVRPAVGSDPA